MIIKILGTESLGVRGLSCTVELKHRKIFIDPGIALGWSRHGFLPHPFQVAIGAGIRDKIIDELKTASDVIFSHFDGDHCPLYNANPYQLGINEVKNSLSNCRIWAKGPENSPPIQQKRRKRLSEILKKNLPNTEGMKNGPLTFSFPVPHGRQGKNEHMVMLTRIEEDGETFVHASDTQLFGKHTIELILDWKPEVVLVSGPPLYHYSGSAFDDLIENGKRHAMELSKNVPTVIIDHHLLRSEEGINWLTGVKQAARNNICSAAEFMKRKALFLEAWREELYEWLPVSDDWHGEYQQGNVNFNDYRIRGWEALITNHRIEPCKWYSCCPIKEYSEAGKLERYWIEEYCLVSNKNCLRYKMEEKGEYHPDNMLPNGEIREGL